MPRDKKKSPDVTRTHRVDDGSKFRLADFDPGATDGLGSIDKDQAEERLREGVEILKELQEKLYAQDRWSLLLIFQAMDAAGKDGTIKHVMSGVNPQGVEVYPFKQPTEKELDHDFMWRHAVCLPERGRIGIFNRSYYEEVLVVRVHQELLTNERLPTELVSAKIWDERLEDIRAFERYLGRNGVMVRKFFLHVSKAEQRRRFLKRLEQPEKNWKFSMTDVSERAHWNEYMSAYEKAIRGSATPDAPWFVVPADHKWYTRLVVVGAVIDAMLEMDLAFPTLDAERRAELDVARKALLAEGD